MKAIRLIFISQVGHALLPMPMLPGPPLCIAECIWHVLFFAVTLYDPLIPLLGLDCLIIHGSVISRFTNFPV